MASTTILTLLDRLRAIAQLGLNYTKDPYDQARYTQLFEIACEQYSELTGHQVTEIRKQFQKELGYVTTKAGVNAALFNQDGELLLARRADDNCWELPGGWIDAGETAEHAIEREMLEMILLEYTNPKPLLLYVL